MQKRRILHVPLDEVAYRNLKLHAKQLGFSSAQAYIRFWASAELRAQTSLIVGKTTNLANPKSQALHYIELVLAREPRDFYDVESTLQFIRRHIGRVDSYRFFKAANVSTNYRQNPDTV